MYEEDADVTPYDRIGGSEAIAKLIVEFYQRVLNDPELSPFFADTPIDKLAHMQGEFFAMALGGPVEYTGRPLNEVHAGMGIRTTHLQRFMNHLMETLEGYELTRDERYDIVSRLHTYADDVTGGVTESW